MKNIESIKRQSIRKRIINTSFLLAPITFYYFSPYVIVEAARNGIINGSFIIFGIQFITALYLGRSFCGWACPAAGLQELCMKIRTRKVKTGWPDLIKYIFIWAPWVGTIIYFASEAGGYKKVDFLFMTQSGLSVADLPSFISFVIVFGLFAIVALSLGRRAFCHYGCWMAPFMVAGTKLRDLLKLPGIRLKPAKDNCINCKECNENCPMSLDVNSMVQDDNMSNSECILCGSCADTCKQEVIHYTFKL